VFLIHEYISSHLRDVFIYIQRFIFIHIHDRNIGSTRCDIHSAFSAHHLCAFWSQLPLHNFWTQYGGQGDDYYMKGQNKDPDSSNCTNLAVYSVPGPEVFWTRYSISEVLLGEQRWRNSESPRQCGLGSLPDRWCHTWVEFVVGSCLALWVFLRGLRFSLIHKKNKNKIKTNISKF